MRAVLFGLVVIGCTDQPIDPIEPVNPDPADPGGLYNVLCTTMTCRNSPEVLRYGMWEANLFGEPDFHGLHLETSEEGRVQLFKGYETYDLHVENGRLFGTQPGFVLEHGDLRTAELHVWRGTQPLYNITINSARMITLPVGKQIEHEIYDMTWHDVGKPWSPEEICNPTEWPLGREDLDGMSATEVIVYERDRYNAKDITLNTNDEADENWFNFGCSGRALAKMRLLGWSEEIQAQLGSALPWSGGWEERQAAFKMLSADYCGKGIPFTQTGVSVMYSDGEHVPYARTPTNIEALWSEKGAMCVNQPRLALAGVHSVWNDMLAADCLPINCDYMAFPGPGPGAYDFGDNAQIISAFWN